MLSKHPLDLPPGRKLSREEVADALRLSIIAELDAVNLYLQLARAIDDERVRRIFEDIAREEKTHVGEFLALLKSLDPEQVSELREGAREVAELTGIAVPDPPAPEEAQPEPLTADEWSYLLGQFKSAADSARVFRRYLPVTRVGRGAYTVPLERPSGQSEALPLRELAVKFRLSQQAIDYSRATKQPLEIADALRAAVELGFSEDRAVLEALANLKEAIRLPATSWDEPGTALSEVAAAVAELIKAQAPPPFVVFVNPSRYAKLLAVHEKTGVMELTRVKALAEVASTPALPEDTVLVVSATSRVLDLVLGADTEVAYLGPEDGYHAFRAWETLAVRVRFERGVAVLKQR